MKMFEFAGQALEYQHLGSEWPEKHLQNAKLIGKLVVNVWWLISDSCRNLNLQLLISTSEVEKPIVKLEHY